MKLFLFPLVIVLLCSNILLAESDPLTIITYNIHHGEGLDGKIDINRIATLIKASDPHIVCLQEVDCNLPRSNYIDMPEFFAEKLGMHVVFESNYQFAGGDYGNATLSKLPIITSRNIALPNPISAEPRGCLLVTVKWNGISIDIMNTHLGLNGQERLAQAEALVKELSENPVILAGDMNENATAPAMKILSKYLSDSFKQSTVSLRGTIPADNPNRRIDYIFTSKSWKVLSSLIIHNDISRIASDHLPYKAGVCLSPE